MSLYAEYEYNYLEVWLRMRDRNACACAHVHEAPVVLRNRTKNKKMASRRSSVENPTSKKRRTGIDPTWSEDFPWMVPTNEGLGMICSLCRRHSRRPKRSVVGKAIWMDVPCQSITRQALVKHSQSESHVEAVKMETTLC